MRFSSRKQASWWWDNGLRFLLTFINVQVLVWVVLHTAHGGKDTGRAAFPGHTEAGATSWWSSAASVAEALPQDVWARGLPTFNPVMQEVQELLSDKERGRLRALCGRTLYHSLQNVVVSHGTGQRTFLATGDNPLMRLRDSAVQLGVLLPRIARRPALRRVVEGGIRAQAFYILQDPYAGGFYPEWKSPGEHSDADKKAGRGGWVASRLYSPDAGAYFLNLLWNYFRTAGLYNAERFLAEPLIYDAAATLVRQWVREQEHNDTTPYRSPDLGNAGLGGPVEYTGLTWSGFRPSDEAATHGYSIPANMYVAGALQRALALNAAVWHSTDFVNPATQLLHDIEKGLKAHGSVRLSDGQSVYAYEVDGLGNRVTDFDEPTWPSLLAMPLLGWSGYDPTLYATTRRRLLSDANSYWLEGRYVVGMGSPSTGPGMARTLATLADALTAESAEERVDKLHMLLKMQCQDGLMHESVDVTNPRVCTGRWYEWANALSVAAVEQLTGEDCDEAAEAAYRAAVAGKGRPAHEAMFRQGLEAQVQWDVPYVSRVDASAHMG